MLKLADVGSDGEILGFVCFQTHETCGDGPRDGPYRHIGLETRPSTGSSNRWEVKIVFTGSWVGGNSNIVHVQPDFVGK